MDEKRKEKAEKIKEIQDARLEAQKAENAKKLKHNEVSLAKQDAKIANISADAAKKKSQFF